MQRIALVGAALLAVAACGKDDKSKGEGAAPADEAEAPPATKSADTAAQRAHDEAVATVGAGKAKREYDVESAKIVFQYTGMEEGTVTAWVADYGKTVVLHREMTKPGVQDQVVVWKDGKNAQWDLAGDQKSVHVTSLRNRGTELRFISIRDPKQLEAVGYEKRPDEQVAGVTAEVWHTPKQDVTLWRWKGIDIKAINRAVKSVEIKFEATSIEEGAALPTDLMKYPDGYEVNDRTK